MHLRLLALALSMPLLMGAQSVSTADRARFEEIKARHDRGEPISAGDQQFAQGIMARQQSQQQQQAQQNADYAKAHPPRESTGLVPLPDLGTGSYLGEQGGLYPGGQNMPPAALRQVPCDAV